MTFFRLMFQNESDGSQLFGTVQSFTPPSSPRHFALQSSNSPSLPSHPLPTSLAQDSPPPPPAPLQSVSACSTFPPPWSGPHWSHPISTCCHSAQHAKRSPGAGKLKLRMSKVQVSAGDREMGRRSWDFAWFKAEDGCAEGQQCISGPSRIMDYTECLLNCAGENLFTNCSWYLKKRRTPIYTQVPSKQHCRLSICSYFGCVWQILRIWDEQACLVPSPNQSSMCVTSRRQLGTGGWKRQWRSRIAMEGFAQHRKHRRRWPAPGSQVFAKP